MRLIPYYGIPVGETREASFLEAFGRRKEITRIVSFGTCNYACPYCMRDAQFVDENGNIISSEFIDEKIIFETLEKAVLNNERIRLSGGEPSLHLKESLKIGKWLEGYEKKLSLCHNGSNPSYIKKMIPYLEYAAIDLKGITAKEYSLRAGITIERAEKNIKKFFNICNMILENDILLDIRTCVFSDTSLESLLEIAFKIDSLKGKKFWTIRNYDPVNTIDWEPMDILELEKNIQIISIKYPKLKIGYRDKWSKGKFIYWENNISKEI